MHGRIAAANRTDRKGAMFTITLPMAQDQQRLDFAA
jgi:K+-sensing histidine kinase KdpD